MFFRLIYFSSILTFIAAFNSSVVVAKEPTFPSLGNPVKEEARPLFGQEQQAQLDRGSDLAIELDPAKVLTSVDGREDRWRASVNSPSEGALQLIFTTGKRSAAPNGGPISKIWASYSEDWNAYLSSGRTVRFRYIFSDSTAGMKTTFRFGATADSRKNSSQRNCELALVYNDTACTFSVNRAGTSGNLPKPVTAGTEVTVELSPSKMATITVGDTLILEDQPIDFSQCYVTFVSDSSELNSENKYTDIRISRMIVEVE